MGNNGLFQKKIQISDVEGMEFPRVLKKADVEIPGVDLKRSVASRGVKKK